MEKRKRIYISLPISGRDEGVQRKRAAELAGRLEKNGYDYINPFDIADSLNETYADGNNGYSPTWYDYMGEDLFQLLQCDGILMDENTKDSLGCCVELAVAQVLTAKRTFLILHTKEQWGKVKSRYII